MPTLKPFIEQKYDHTLQIPAHNSNLDDKSLKLTSDFSDLE